MSHLRSPVGKLGNEPVVVDTAARANQHPVGPAHHRAGSTHVIEVVVGQHQEIETSDAQIGQARAERGRLRTGIDERHVTSAPHEDRVSLADVARGDPLPSSTGPPCNC